MNKIRNLLIVTAVLAVAGVGRAGEISQSTKPWVPLKHVETEKAFAEIPSGATVAMACSMCKSVSMISQQWVATKPSGGTVERALTVHGCSGCGGEMTTELKQTKMIHKCSMCGDKSAFCCATMPGKPTPGMEEKKP